MQPCMDALILISRWIITCTVELALNGICLCQYHKWTNIYYLTWSFENVAKDCQFQFLDLPTPYTKKTLLGGGIKNDVTEMIHLLTFQSIKNVLYFFFNWGGGVMNGKVFEHYSITFKNIWGVWIIFWPPLFPWNLLMMGEGGLFLQVFINQT